MGKKKGRRPRRETAMPCAPPKEEEVRVGYLSSSYELCEYYTPRKNLSSRKKLKKYFYFRKKPAARVFYIVPDFPERYKLSQILYFIC